jgi:hypothetical protein
LAPKIAIVKKDMGCWSVCMLSTKRRNKVVPPTDFEKRDWWFHKWEELHPCMLISKPCCQLQVSCLVLGVFVHSHGLPYVQEDFFFSHLFTPWTLKADIFLNFNLFSTI